MTISTIIPDATRARAGEARRGARRTGAFSLVELLVAISLSSMALAAVFSTFIFVARSCLATSDYTDMTQEARTALELFARDVRMATDVSSLSSNAVTLQVLTASGTKTVNYTYIPGTKTFYRDFGTSSQRRLITHIESFQLTAYSLLFDSVTGQPLETTNPIEIKQLQLQLRSVRSGPAKASASNNVVSARYILRNKIPD